MSPTQTWIGALAFLAVATALILVGALCGNDTLLGAGIGLLPGIAGILGIKSVRE